MIYIIIIINNELLAYDKHNNYIVIDNFLSDCAQLANTSVQKQTQLVYSQLSLIHFSLASQPLRFLLKRRGWLARLDPLYNFSLHILFVRVLL